MFKEILRNPTFDFIRINDIQIFVVRMSKPASKNARTDHLFHHAWRRNFVQVKTVFSISNGNLPICPESGVGDVGSKAGALARCFFSRLFNGRLSSINMSRFSSFATASAPEDNLGSRAECGSTQASLQRSILLTQARHHCLSPRRRKNRHQTRRGPQSFNNRVPRTWEANRATAQLQHERRS